MEKPGKIDLMCMDTKKIAFSGKLGGLGMTILDDWRKAKHVTCNDWNEEQFKNYGIQSPHKKPMKPMTMKIHSENFEKMGTTNYQHQNFSTLHRPKIHPMGGIN